MFHFRWIIIYLISPQTMNCKHWEVFFIIIYEAAANNIVAISISME